MIKMFKFDDESALQNWFRVMGSVKITAFETFVEDNEVRFMVKADIPYYIAVEGNPNNMLYSVAGSHLSLRREK